MNLMPVKVVVIHDDLIDNAPLLIKLREKYGDENVIFKKKSQEGLDYVLNNLSQKIIVILDLKFKTNEKSGVEVFEEIREKTSLIYIIIWTASTLTDVKSENLVKFINNDALAFVYSTEDYTRILQLVDKAVHELDVRVASVIEQWISSRSDEEKTKPYVMLSDGKTYTLLEILEEIRGGTEFGKQIEKDILLLAINLLMRGKEKING